MEREKRRRRRKAVFLFGCPSLILAMLGIGFVLSIVLPIALTTGPRTSSEINAITLKTFETISLGINEMLNAGDIITIVLTVCNTGTEPVSGGLVETNAQLGSLSCVNVTILPGANVSCTLVHIIVQDDVNAGEYLYNVTYTADPMLMESVTGVVELTENTMPSLYVFVSGATDLGDNMILEPGDVVIFSTKLLNTGSETLVNIDVNDGENSVASLAPMEMVLLVYNYSITSNDTLANEVSYTVVVNATGLITQESFITTFTTTTNLSQSVVPSLEISDRLYFVGNNWTHPHFGDLTYWNQIPFFADEIIGCPTQHSAWFHDINVTNTGTEIITGVTVTQWRLDSLVIYNNMSPDSWTMDCSPMFMTNEIGTMLPGETQMCRVIYVGFIPQFYPKNVFTGMTLTNQIYEFPFNVLHNTTRATNATVTGTGMTTGFVVSESTPTSDFIVGGWNFYYIYDSALMPPSQYSTCDVVFTNIARKNLPVQTPAALFSKPKSEFAARRKFELVGYREQLCETNPFDINTFEFGGNMVLPITITISNFALQAQHNHGYMRIIFQESANSLTITPAFDVAFLTDPPTAINVWNVFIESTVVTTSVCSWNAMTKLLSCTASTNTEPQSTLITIDLGDLRAYNSISFSSSNLPVAFEDETLFYLNEAIDLVPEYAPERDLGNFVAE